LAKKSYDILWVMSEKMGGSIISMASFFTYAFYLTPAEIGIVTIVLSISMGVGQIVATLFQDPLVCAKKINVNTVSSIFIGGVIIVFLISLILIFLVFIISGNSTFLELTLVSVLIIPILFMNGLYSALLRRRMKFKSLSQRVLIGKLLGATTGVVSVVYGFGAISMVAQAVLIEFFGFILLVKIQKLGVIKTFDLIEFRNFIKLGISVALRKLSWEGYIKGLPLVIGAYLGASAVGVFAFAWRIVDMPRTALVSGALSYALPIFSNHKNKMDLTVDFIKFSKITMLIFGPIFTGLALVAEPLVITLFGDKWLDAIPIIKGLAIFTLISFITLYIPTVLTALLTPKTTLKADVISSITSLLLCIMLIPYIGLFSVVITFVYRSLFNFPFTTREIYKRMGLSVLSQLRIHLSSLIALLCMSIVVTVFQHVFYFESIKMLYLSVTLGAITYMLIIYLLEKKLIYNLLR